MHRFHSCRCSTAPIVFALVIDAICGAGEPARPNIITIVTDDQAVWTIGAYGNSEAQTPHLDRLAAEGARFTNALVATPVCSPSRVEFFTGLYGTQVGITDYLNRDEEAAGVGLPDTAVTWPAVLRRHGYTTGLIGKWHLGTLPQFHPTRHGFDRFYGWLLTPKWIDPVLEVDGRPTQLRGPLHDVMFDEALRFVEEKRNEPFALVITPLAPHAPYGPVPEVDRAPYEDADLTVPSFSGLDADHVRAETRKYYASVRTIDRNVGRLLDGLDKFGLAERTIVLFTSDHGYMIGHHGLQHKGNANWIGGGVRGPRRPNMYDLSLRVPLLVRWPGVVRPGTVVDHTVSNVDTFASVLGLSGVPLPEGVKQNGSDFSPLLRGISTPQRDAFFGQYDLHNGGLAYMRMIRTDDWKLVRYYRSNDQDELYDLRNDADELTNLNNDPSAREVRNDLQLRLESWMRLIDDPLLVDPGYDASLSRRAPTQRRP